VSHHLHASDLKPEQIRLPQSSGWRRLPAIAGVVGVGGLAAAFAMKGGHEKQFYFSYLTAYMYVLAIALGGLFFTLVQHAVRAGWSVVVRRIAENVAITLPVMGLLALPIFLGAHDLFHWTHADAVEHDAMLKWKEPYLNEGRFRIFGVGYVLIWTLVAARFYGWSTSQDTAADPGTISHKMRWWAPLSLLLFGVTLTFAALDWLMSLDPHWFSTVFGVYYFAGVVVSFHSFLAVTVLLLQRSGQLRGVVTIEHYHDIGKMMFAFSVFWAYIAFSQYMLYWYASIPEETYWFSYRGQGDWLVLSLVLVFGRFVLPFVLFMSRRWKRRASSLGFWAVWMLVVQYLDMYWLVQPVLAHEHGSTEIHFGVLDLTTLVGVLGIFLAAFSFMLGRQALIPLKDPRIDESLNHENF
jgi:hypothetical protein